MTKLEQIGFKLTDRMSAPLSASELQDLCHSAEYHFDSDADRIELMLQRAFDNFKERQSSMNWNILVAMMAAHQSVNN